MADISSATLSETAGSNNAAAPDGWPEGQSAASVNNCARETHGFLKRYWNRTRVTVTSSGSDPAYVVAYGTAPPALVNGMRFAFNASFANLGTTPTVNVNALGAVTIKKHGPAGLAAMTAGDIQIGHHVEVEYDSSAAAMVIISPIPSATTAFTGGALATALNEAKGADIASASTCDIGAATGNYINVTGTTTINALGTVQAGTRRIVNFNGILTLTYNASSLILPGAASIVTAAGDTATFISLGGGNWICTQYQRAIGFFVLTVKKQVFTSTGTYTPSTGMLYCLVEMVGGGGGGGTGSNSAHGAGGGGAGEYSRALLTAAQIGTSKAVTIPAAAAAAGTGGTVTLTTLCTAIGGAPGAAGSSQLAAGGLGGTGGTADFAATGAPGGWGQGNSALGLQIAGGIGGSSSWGGGGLSPIGASTGNAGTGFGSGGSGAAGNNAGGAGTKGIVYITEWCSQ